MLKQKGLPLVISLVCVQFSSSLSAHNFKKADELFSQRSQSFEKASEAHEAYEEMTVKEKLSEEDRIYAISQMARLDLYRGAMLEGVSNSKRKEVLEGCIDNIDKIKSTKTEQYFYYKMTCIAFRGKLANFIGRVKYGLMMRSIQDDALKATTSEAGKLEAGIEAGGILRTLSAIRGNRKAKALGLYDPNEALSFIQIALKAPAREVRPYPAPLSGSDYYENSYYLAQAHIALGLEDAQKDKITRGKEILKNTVEELEMLEENDLLPEGREPETRFYKKLIHELLESVNLCQKENKWASCLKDQLE